MTEDAEKVLNCIMNCETSLYIAAYAPDHAVVPISNIAHLLKWTKYRIRKAIKELKELDLVEYKSQGRPAIMSYGAESYPELLDEARPPINGYALTQKAFESDMWKEAHSKWEDGINEWFYGFCNTESEEEK